MAVHTFIFLEGRTDQRKMAPFRPLSLSSRNQVAVKPLCTHFHMATRKARVKKKRESAKGLICVLSCCHSQTGFFFAVCLRSSNLWQPFGARRERVRSISFQRHEIRDTTHTHTEGALSIKALELEHSSLFLILHSISFPLSPPPIHPLISPSSYFLATTFFSPPSLCAQTTYPRTDRVAQEIKTWPSLHH